MKQNIFLRRLLGRRGATIVFVALAMVVLLSFAALAVDLGYLYVVRNELQNAADSGALAGAQVLYLDNGTAVNPLAQDTAIQYAQSNSSEKVPVIVESAQRGHWSFATREFTANDSLQAVDLWDVSTQELDENPDFINAVQVITRRTEAGVTPPQHFFARIFGAAPSQIRTTAVAYIGFAGTLRPADAEQPIAICKESIRDDEGNYTCGVGRMINSGTGNDGHQTGGWTNFTQPCETASTPTIRPLICSSGNPDVLTLGTGMGTVGGQVQTAADQLRDCWMAGSYDTDGDNLPDQPIDTDGDGWPDQPWSLMLPVIDCPDNNVGPCSTVVGAVTVNVVWITRNDKNQMNEVPTKMGNWPPVDGSWPDHYTGPLVTVTDGRCADTGSNCWQSFVSYFNLQDVLNDAPAFYEDKTIYFLPRCEPNIPAGVTGGENFGILAKIPVLVR